jgi:hypothetical protein
MIPSSRGLVRAAPLIVVSVALLMDGKALSQPQGIHFQAQMTVE